MPHLRRSGARTPDALLAGDAPSGGGSGGLRDDHRSMARSGEQMEAMMAVAPDMAR
jgi:hypothetical protein